MNDDGARAGVRWRPVDPSEADWLASSNPADDWTGMSGGAFESAVWILNAMYIGPGDPDETHDDLHWRRIDDGTAEPDVVDRIAGRTCTVIGGGLGRSEHPGPGWRRLRWAEAAASCGEPLAPATSGDREVPPCFRWLPGMRPNGSWPSNIIPPSEGSLDRESWERLLEVLAGQSPSGGDTECIAYYSSATSADMGSAPTLLRGALRHAAELYDNPLGCGSPANFWAADHSWLTWSDYDLWGTRVAGSDALVRAIENDAECETVRLPEIDARLAAEWRERRRC
ncbi:hypothetical protein [Gordonia iterans]